MSTLAACRADNFYHPPDYDPKNRKKEIEKKRKEGKLKVRPQGARTIRFEMPFHVRCENCKQMIAKGVRFNAEKKKAGRYLGTIIFQFTMPCTNCKNSMIIKTDPEKCQYLLVSGLTKYCEDFEREEGETIKIQTPDEGEKLNKNPFLKMETEKEDIIRAEKVKPVLMELIKEKKIFKDDYYINRTLRRKLKMEKKQISLRKELALKKCLNLTYLDISEEEEMLAKQAKFKTKNTKFFIRDKIRTESIFSNVDCKNKELSNKSLIFNKKVEFKRNDVNYKSKEINNNKDKDYLFTDKRFEKIKCFTLKNNLSFDNKTHKNEILLKKKHKMDINLQKALNVNNLPKNTFYMMSSNLNLLNNHVKINIKKQKTE